MGFNTNKVKEFIKEDDEFMIIRNHADIYIKLDKIFKKVYILQDFGWEYWEKESYDSYFTN